MPVRKWRKIRYLLVVYISLNNSGSGTMTTKLLSNIKYRQNISDAQFMRSGWSYIIIQNVKKSALHHMSCPAQTQMGPHAERNFCPLMPRLLKHRVAMIITFLTLYLSGTWFSRLSKIHQLTFQISSNKHKSFGLATIRPKLIFPYSLYFYSAYSKIPPIRAGA